MTTDSARPPTPIRRAPSHARLGALLFSHLLRAQRRRSRLIGLGGLSALTLLIAFAVSNSDTRPGDGVETLDAIALSIVIPVAALTVAASSLGDLVEERSLVYLVRSPAPQWLVATSAWAVSVVVVAPVTIVAPAIAGAIVGDDGAARGMLVAGLIGTFAYCGVFVYLGVATRRAVIWGLAYVLIWEQFAANAGEGLARLAILSYTRSLLSDATDVDLRLADRATGAALLIGPLLAVIGVALTARHLRRAEID